jgi:hypothetical protein
MKAISSRLTPYLRKQGMFFDLSIDDGYKKTEESFLTKTPFVGGELCCLPKGEFDD